MKKILFVLVALALTAATSFANESYKLDDNKINTMFNSATETSIFVADMNLVNNNMVNVSSTSGSNTGTILVAWVVDWFLGGFGIHRYVLGTKGSMWAIYTFTVCGIFGIVPTVDWFVLLIDGLILGNGDKYMDNKKFFMWAGGK
jgi:TM2 domain.